MKNKRKYLKPFLNEPSENDVIVIRRDVLDNKEISLVVSHELYHYLDKLIKLNKEFSNFIIGPFFDCFYLITNVRISFLTT